MYKRQDKNTVTIPALGGSLTVTANLESIPLRTITILDTERGTITAQVNGQDVAQVADGTEVTFTAVPDSYWMFKNWTGDAAEQTESSFTIAVTQNISIGAVFQEAMNYEAMCIRDRIEDVNKLLENSRGLFGCYFSQCYNANPN